MNIFDDALHQLDRRGITLETSKKIAKLGKLYKELSELHRTTYINATNHEITEARRNEAQKAVFDEVNKIVKHIKEIENE